MCLKTVHFVTWKQNEVIIFLAVVAIGLCDFGILFLEWVTYFSDIHYVHFISTSNNRMTEVVLFLFCFETSSLI